MKKIFALSYFVFLVSYSLFSQSVGIGTNAPNASAQLDIASTNKGLLIPRMNSAAITAIPTPAKGLMVLDTAKNQLMFNIGTPAVPNWQTIVSKSGWNLTGNAGINPATQFIGTTDTFPLNFRVGGAWAGQLSFSTGNVFLGFSTGSANSTGSGNVAIGIEALAFNRDQNDMIAIGSYALTNYQHPSEQRGPCVAIGPSALYSNTHGQFNNAIGQNALYSNTFGNLNTAVGQNALYFNTDGESNIAIGANSLYKNTGGNINIAMGEYALYNNQTGSENIASGYRSLEFNVGGNANISLGRLALYSNTESYNAAIGESALAFTTASQYNVAVGHSAGSAFDNGYNNVFVGANTETNGAGYFNVIALGQAVTCTAPSQARIGNAATNSIGGYANWSNISDGRYKKDVNENVPGIDFIMQLRPVTYHLNVSSLSKKLNEGRGRQLDKYSLLAIADKEKILQTGFVAQEVEATANKMGYDFSGVDKPKNENDLYALRYAEFVVPLVKAMQEQQLTIDLLKRQNSVLERKLAAIEEKLLVK
ncbi:MAG: tail fiber domain-containing protein [Chitinophagaceae bacterium]|nr:tail fiber domain-containing protein [Chitinophagaceae bacterium]